MSTTYDDLVKTIKATSGRTDSQTINAIPQFIAAAQTKLDSELRVAEMLVTTDFPADGLTITPPGALALDRVIISGDVAHQKPLEVVLTLRKMNDRTPVNIYAMNGKSIELHTPAEATVSAFTKPPRLSATNQTNAYTEGAENALLWLSLSYLGVFARDSEATNAWMQLANSEIELLNASYEAYMSSGELQEAQHEPI